MSDYFIAAHGQIGAPGPASQVDATPRWPIGYIANGIDRAAGTALGGAAGEFVYCRGSNVASIGQFVNIENGSAVIVASANSAKALPVGVAAGLLTATNVYGWVQVQGRVDYAHCTNHSFAASIACFLGSTAGYIGSVYGAGLHVPGIYPPASLHSSLSAGSMTFQLNRPFQFGAAVASSN